jgi:hypothetical protein
VHGFRSPGKSYLGVGERLVRLAQVRFDIPQNPRFIADQDLCLIACTPAWLKIAPVSSQATSGREPFVNCCFKSERAMPGRKDQESTHSLIYRSSGKKRDHAICRI